MARLKHKPGHPLADEHGWVEEDAYYDYNKRFGSFESTDSNRYTNGNEKVTIHYIPDEMAPTRHMANGKLYTSKKKFRDETRARGCIEIGNETTKVLAPRKRIELDRRQRADDIRRAIYEVKNGRRP